MFMEVAGKTVVAFISRFLAVFSGMARACIAIHVQCPNPEGNLCKGGRTAICATVRDESSLEAVKNIF
jgi:hypothetical protein